MPMTGGRTPALSSAPRMAGAQEPVNTRAPVACRKLRRVVDVDSMNWPLLECSPHVARAQDHRATLAPPQRCRPAPALIRDRAPHLVAPRAMCYKPRTAGGLRHIARMRHVTDSLTRSGLRGTAPIFRRDRGPCRIDARRAD